jgi:hypothetical protein
LNAAPGLVVWPTRASLGDGPYRPRDILAALGIGATGGLSEYRDRLIRKGMIYSPSYGELGFTVPHFADLWGSKKTSRGRRHAPVLAQ